MRQPRILIADDHQAVAEALALSLAQWFDVTGYVLTLEALAERLKRDPIAVVVLDLSFKGANALEQLYRLRAIRPATKFVIFTASNERVLVDVARRAGASGFVVKESSTAELQKAIHEALAGHEYVSPSLRSATRAPVGARQPGTASSSRVPTHYQMEVLGLLHRGCTQQEAADSLGIARKTVEYHLREAGKRLGFKGTLLLVRWYEEQLEKPS